MDFPYIDIEATGSNIRRMRTERGIRVADISDFLMIDKQAVYRWEYGKSLPQLDNCLALARMFGTTIEDILVEKGEAAASPFNVAFPPAQVSAISFPTSVFLSISFLARAFSTDRWEASRRLVS